MATDEIPNDRAVLAASRKLKAYAAYKGRQSQSEIDRDQALDADLATVETWALDDSDTGFAWADARRAAAARDEALAARWQATVAHDERQAAAEAEQRRQVSPQQIRDEIGRRIDEHAAAVASLAEAKAPGYRGRLSQVRRESLQAKKFLDGQLEQSLDDTARRTAAARAQRKRVADMFAERAATARTWRSEYDGQPARYPRGQRDDVRAALGRIARVAGVQADELTPLGSEAAAVQAELLRVRGWAEQTAGQVDTTPPPRSEVRTGIASAREAFAALEALQAQLEREANEHFTVFSAWTQRNTEQARRWIRSDSPKHRRWAEAWLGVDTERGQA